MSDHIARGPQYSGGSVVRIRSCALDGDLADHLPAQGPMTCWLRHGEGMIGIGTALARTFDSAEQANSWWREVALGLTVECDEDLDDEPMAAPLAFLSFPFSPGGDYEMVVPHVIVGSRKGRSWISTWDGEVPDVAGLRCSDCSERADCSGSRDPLPATSPVPAVSFHPHSLDREGWLAAVGEAITRIGLGEVSKVVLARDEIGVSPAPIDLRHIVSYLHTHYPQTWTFCVKGLVGASPELLIRQDRGLITSRVLAGTIHGDRDDSSLARALSSSSKDLAEHEFAVESVAQALRGHVTSLHVPEVPFVLRLPNVMHLASDISGAVKPGSTLIDLSSAIHPSAAVCGTPTEQARSMIAELESLDRGRYAGPVGWVNAQGDGEVALALRCGLVDGSTVQIFAGCGIVDGSDPTSEWEETVAKLLPMKQALSSPDSA